MRLRIVAPRIQYPDLLRLRPLILVLERSFNAEVQVSHSSVLTTHAFTQTRSRAVSGGASPEGVDRPSEYVSSPTEVRRALSRQPVGKLR
jgi:hypothetical protein